MPPAENHARPAERELWILHQYLYLSCSAKGLAAGSSRKPASRYTKRPPGKLPYDINHEKMRGSDEFFTSQENFIILRRHGEKMRIRLRGRGGRKKISETGFGTFFPNVLLHLFLLCDSLRICSLNGAGVQLIAGIFCKLYSMQLIVLWLWVVGNRC